ncbi:MAG: hypothetical protein ACJAZO_001887 [Myxococcota bacterium]|jgi:hypothetical protein
MASLGHVDGVRFIGIPRAYPSRSNNCARFYDGKKGFGHYQVHNFVIDTITMSEIPDKASRKAVLGPTGDESLRLGDVVPSIPPEY